MAPQTDKEKQQHFSGVKQSAIEWFRTLLLVLSAAVLVLVINA